jgi:hypothetical protein
MTDQATKLRYPYIFYGKKVKRFPLVSGLRGEPCLLDLSSESSLFDGVDPRDQRRYQSIIDDQMSGSCSWGLASYMEDRRKLLSSCPQMRREGRFFHLGLDIIVPAGTVLHAPLDSVVEIQGYEEGEGNYGGFVLLRHSSDRFQTFYSLYGHLALASLPPRGEALKAGEAFARVGDFNENGNWFHHTHLQILTEKGLERDFISRGYCSAKDLPVIDSLCPSPLMLFTV